MSSLQDYWEERGVDSSGMDIKCPIGDLDLHLRGDPAFPRNFEPVLLEFRPCILENPISECASYDETISEL